MRETSYCTDGALLRYFKRPFYDQPTVDYNEARKQAFGIAEFLTILAGTDGKGDFDASGFTGPALVSLLLQSQGRYCQCPHQLTFRQAITGVNDYIVCDGFCEGVFDEPASTFYRNAKPFVPYLHPDASHNFNFHHNATGAYAVITGFLADKLV